MRSSHGRHSPVPLPGPQQAGAPGEKPAGCAQRTPSPAMPTKFPGVKLLLLPAGPAPR